MFVKTDSVAYFAHCCISNILESAQNGAGAQ